MSNICLHFKADFYFSVIHQHYPTHSPIYEIKHGLKKAYKACGTMLQAWREAPQASTEALKLLMHKFQFYTFTSVLSHSGKRSH